MDPVAMLDDRLVMRLAPGRLGWVCIILTLAACREDPPPTHQGVWDRRPEQRWRVVETLRIGLRHGEAPAAFGNIRSVLVDRMARIWVVDRTSVEIRVFAPDGKFVRTIGRSGEGPGEFRSIGHAFHGPNGEIWVEDMGRRWEVFDTAGKRIGGHRLPFRQGNMSRAWNRQGVFVLRHGGKAKFFRIVGGMLRPTGREFAWPTNPLAVPDRVPPIRFESKGPIPSVIEPGIPFASYASSFLGPGLALDYWRADVSGPGRYEVRRTNLEDGRDMTVFVRHRYEPATIPDSVRRAAADSLLERYTSGTTKLTSYFHWTMIPRHYPAFDRVFASPSGEVWVRRTLAGGIVGFDVFDEHGKYLGQPEVPKRLGSMRINVIDAASIYAVDIDDLGVEYVVRMDVWRGMERTESRGIAH